MRPPARYQQVLADQRWEAAFGRQNSVEEVLDYVLRHWTELQRNPPADMAFSSPEPRITQYFGTSLRKNARLNGVTGQFVTENQHADVDEVKKILQARGRSDISYFSDRIDPPLEFVLEFKKMKLRPGGSQSRLAYCRDGVMRFVDAVYARDSDFGFMVGLVDTRANEGPIASALVSAVQHPDMVQQLRIIRDGAGRAIASSAALKFRQSRFETRHARDHVPRHDVLLGHLVLVHEP